MIPQLETKQYRAFFILILGGMLIDGIYKSWYSNQTLLNTTILWISFIVLTWIIFKYDRIEFARQKTKLSFLSSVIASIICLVGIIIHLQIFLVFNSPNLIVAHHNGDISRTTYYFKISGTVIIENETRFESKFEYGEFIIENSTIKLKVDGEFTSDKLKFAKDKLIFEQHNSKEVMANQITTKGRGIKKNIELKITEDNR